MPFMIKIGVQRENKNGLTSKGHQIFRKGTHVYMYWGVINVMGNFSKKFYWNWKPPQHKKVYLRTIEKAEKYKKQRISEILNEGYQVLPTGTRIYLKRGK